MTTTPWWSTWWWSPGIDIDGWCGCDDGPHVETMVYTTDPTTQVKLHSCPHRSGKVTRTDRDDGGKVFSKVTVTVMVTVTVTLKTPCSVLMVTVSTQCDVVSVMTV